MSGEFDPYHKWLGIAPEEQPANHYRLLGINVFECDPDVISNAADQRMGHIRSFQSGKRADLSQRILNEIASARVCLLDLEKKAEYDAVLRAELTPAPAATRAIPTAVPLAQDVVPLPDRPVVPPALPTAPGVSQAPVPSAPVDSAAGDPMAPVVIKGRRRTPNYLPLVIAAVAGILALMVVLAIIAATGGFRGREVAQPPTPEPPPEVFPRPTPAAGQPDNGSDDEPNEPDPGGGQAEPVVPVVGKEVPGVENGEAPPDGGQTVPGLSDGTPEDVGGGVKSSELAGSGGETPHDPSVTKATKSIPPDDKSVATARQQLEAQFAGQPPQKIIEQAIARADYDVDTFAMLCMARDGAAAAGDVRTALSTIDELEARFEVDVLDMKVTLLDKLSANVKETDGHRETAELALSLAEQAMDRGRNDVASDCATKALGAARKCGDSNLVRKATLIIVKLPKP